MRSDALFSIFLAVLCLAAVPHPFCYYLDSKKEVGSELHLSFRKNPFYLDCERTTSTIVRTERDIVVFLNGVRHLEMRNEEACIEGK